MEKKRSVAYKVRIQDLLDGKYVSPGGFNPNYILTPLGLRLSRVHLLATVVNTFISTDNKYAFIVVDDGSGIIRAKAFQDTKIISDIKRGDVVDFVGKVREYNQERYLIPELVKKVSDQNIETLRKLEILKFLKDWKQKRTLVFSGRRECSSLEELRMKLAEKGISADEVESILETEQLEEESGEQKAESVDNASARDVVLKIVAELDKGDGVDYQAIIQAVGLPESVAENAINELLSEGSCFEPRAGKIKVLL